MRPERRDAATEADLDPFKALGSFLERERAKGEAAKGGDDFGDYQERLSRFLSSCAAT